MQWWVGHCLWWQSEVDDDKNVFPARPTAPSLATYVNRATRYPLEADAAVVVAADPRNTPHPFSSFQKRCTLLSCMFHPVLQAVICMVGGGGCTW